MFGIIKLLNLEQDFEIESHAEFSILAKVFGTYEYHGVGRNPYDKSRLHR